MAKKEKYMNIMDMFRKAPTQATGAAQDNLQAATQPNSPSQVAQPGQPLPGTATGQGTANNGVVPTGVTGNPGVTGNSDADSPMAKFNDVWQTPNTGNANDDQPIFANVDPAKLMESAKKLDFTKVVPADTFAKIAAGGQEAAQAFAEAMQAVTQASFAQSALATTKIVEQAMSKQREQFDNRLPSMVKNLSVSEGLRASNPLLNSPAVAPLVSALTQTLTVKNPNATSGEIQQQVQDYFSMLGEHFQPKSNQQTTSSQGSKVEDDWSKFFN